MERINNQGTMPLQQSEISSGFKGERAGSANSAREAQGTFQGQPVSVVEDASSMLADAAEEMTFGAGEEVERKLSERKEKRQPRNQLLEQVQLYVDNNGGLESGEFEQLLKQLTLMEGVRASAIVDIVQQYFSDPTDAHAALVTAREALEDQDMPVAHRQALSEELSAAIVDMEATDGPRIRAGYNISGTPAEGLRENAQGLRVLYREAVIDFQDYEKTFAMLNERFGPEEFPHALSFITRALGSDMNAIRPSTSTAQLKEVVDGIYMVETLATLHQDVHVLLQRVEGKHGVQNFSGTDIAQALLRFRAMPMLVEAQAERDMPFLRSIHGARDAEVLQGVRQLAHALPHRIFPSMTVRQNLLDALQGLLDKAVDREEQETLQ